MIFPDYDEASYLKNIDFALADAERAWQLAKGMKQLECDALIVMGLIYRKKAIGFSPSKVGSSIHIPNTKKKIFLENKHKSADCFFDALFLNNEENPRVTVISYLRLAELETLYQPNYLLAKFYFERYEKQKHKVEHKYVLELAEKLEKRLLEKRVPEFYLDTSKSLKYKEWSDDLKRCLISHAIYRKAIEIGGIMPAKRRRSENTISRNRTSTDNKTRQTRQSLLAETFKETIGLAQQEAYSLANKHLKEFENICISINRTSK